MTHEQMLRALQDDVNAWPAAVKAAGVKIASGSAYNPVARNNEVLRTPDDPQATYDFMVRAWSDPDAEYGGTGWQRIITQAGPELTWEWLMVDETKPYASLFPDELRARVRAALENAESTTEWNRIEVERKAASSAYDDRIQRMMDDMRSGKRSRPNL
jgi:hypothetical protein